MAQDRISYFVDQARAQFEAALLADKVRVFVNFVDRSPDDLIELKGRQVYEEMKSQLNDLWSALYVELPDE